MDNINKFRKLIESKVQDQVVIESEYKQIYDRLQKEIESLHKAKPASDSDEYKEYVKYTERLQQHLKDLKEDAPQPLNDIQTWKALDNALEMAVAKASMFVKEFEKSERFYKDDLKKDIKSSLTFYKHYIESILEKVR